MTQRAKSNGVDTIDVHGYVKDVEVLSNIDLRKWLATVVVVVFALSVSATYALIFLWGFRKIELPPAFVHWLGGATIGQTAGMLLLILKDLFPGEKRGERTTTTASRPAAKPEAKAKGAEG